ncbi:transposase [Cohnella lubricantis]|uniref:Transposase n=1 Tax=Cohnella lubricantis TaxID=2163172 RepID=A0A841TBS6_9BACL|nr:transposase [Cohnella lubricantis]MBB6678462.1 transposase [Cohnella lubricantis]MBP2116843.1 transposase-like protein [Cohnella lubricantis]
MEVHLSFDDYCRHYATEESCAEKIYREKWPYGYHCPVCGHNEASVIRTRRLPLYECRKCRHQASLTTRTVMEKSKTSLVKWFQAIYLLSHGATAMQLSHSIKVTYKTAWLIAHKIRHAIKQLIAETPLTGDVRLLESRYGITERFHTWAVHRPMIAAASIAEDGRMNHVRMEGVAAGHLFRGLVTKEAFHQFIHRHIAADADITATAGLHHIARHKPLFRFSLDANRWMNRIYFGIGPKHLKSYLDEYCYRHQFDSQEEPSFTDLLHQCAIRPAIPYRQLILTAS